MDIVQQSDAAARRPILGWCLGVGLFVVEIAFALGVAHNTQGHAAALAAAQGGTMWWDETVGWLIPAVAVVFFLGLFVIPGAFGARGRQIMPFLPRGRWIVLLVFLAIAVGLDAGVILGGEHGGFANVQGAAWTQGGRVVVRHNWSEAVSRHSACVLSGKDATLPKLQYVVRFADGRSANLAYGLLSDPSGPSVHEWVTRLAPVDAAISALPRAARPEFNIGPATDPYCVRRMGNRVAAADLVTVRQVLHLPPAG